MSFGNEKLARLLEQPDVAYDDRLSVCKALADVSTNVQNAIRITESSELIHSMASILNSTHNPHIDVRHQIQVCLTITRCVVAGRDRASIAFSKSPGLIEGLCTLKGDSEPFLRVSASCALRLLSRCDEACGSNRRLLRSKWHNVLKDDSESFKQERAREKECEKSMHLQGPNESEMHAAAAIANSHELPEEIRRDQRLVRSASSTRIEFEPSKPGVYSTHMHAHEKESWASSRETAEHFSLHNSSRSERSSQSERNVSNPPLGTLARGMTGSVSPTLSQMRNYSDVRHNIGSASRSVSWNNSHLISR